MSRVEIADFLLARIAEDEQAARKEVEITNRFFDDRFEVSYVWARTTHLASTGGSGTSFAPGCPSPARVLAECEAKRAIVGSSQSFQVAYEQAHPLEAKLTSAGAVAAFEVTLKFLALPYADHPDYLEEWKP